MEAAIRLKIGESTLRVYKRENSVQKKYVITNVYSIILFFARIEIIIRIFFMFFINKFEKLNWSSGVLKRPRL